MSKVYICTAIPYVNGNPHIGHAVDYLLADVYARFRRNLGDEVRFQIGTDEHGNKVFSTAAKNGMLVEEYAAINSQKFQDFVQKLNVSYTDIIRTTDPDHVRRCQEIWQKLSPHIYSADYDGWYCEGCERFVTQKEYDENQGCCPDHQKPYEKLTEKNYYLRISDFKDEIREQIERDKMQILPEFRKKEVLRLLEDAPDISISRPVGQLSWGVPVPGDDTQVMYVWLDALSNYVTVLGYPDNDISDFWPADAQFIGKDILRFHAITWPAILLGLGLPLPQHIVTHGYVLADGQKMSKSIGNVVDPVAAIDRHGVEAFRYYFSRHIDAFVGYALSNMNTSLRAITDTTHLEEEYLSTSMVTLLANKYRELIITDTSFNKDVSINTLSKTILNTATTCSSLGIKPNIAIISNKCANSSFDSDKITEAIKLVKEVNKDIEVKSCVDLETALNSPSYDNANVLIFHSGAISDAVIKSLTLFGGFKICTKLVQGYKPCIQVAENNASSDEIFNLSIIAAAN